MELKACPSCGAMAPARITSCAYCGAELPMAPSPPSTAAGPAASGAPDPSGWAPPTGSAPPWVAPAPPGPDQAPPPAGPSYVAAGPVPPGALAPPRPARRWGVYALIATVVVVALVGVTVALGMNAVSDLERTALDGDGTWQTFSDPDGAFLVDLPTEPSAGPVERAGQVTSRSYVSMVGRAQFAVHIYDIDGWSAVGAGGEDLLALMPDLMTEWTGGTHNDPIRTTTGGLPAIQFDIDAGDDKWSATAVLTGSRVIFLAAGGPAVAVGAHTRMTDSFRPLEAG